MQLPNNRAERYLPRTCPVFLEGAVNMCTLHASSLCWFATYVKSRHEKTVALGLNGKGIESFLPTYQKVYSNGGKAELPVFANYVFCRLELQQTLQVVMTPGVFSILSCGNVPTAIPDVEIDALRRMLGSGLPVKPWPYVSQGSVITIKSGPLRGVQAVVQDEKHLHWLVLSLEILHRAVAVKIDRGYLS
jgi:transcription termination/antitermination protein NusG